MCFPSSCSGSSSAHLTLPLTPSGPSPPLFPSSACLPPAPQSLASAPTTAASLEPVSNSSFGGCSGSLGGSLVGHVVPPLLVPPEVLVAASAGAATAASTGHVASSAAQPQASSAVKVAGPPTPDTAAACKASWLGWLDVAGDFIDAAAEEIQADHKVVLAAVEVTGHAFESALAELQASVSFVLALETSLQRELPPLAAGSSTSGDNTPLGHASFVDATGRLRGAILRFAAAQVAADQQVIVDSAKQSGGALHFAMAEVAADHTALRDAVETDRQRQLAGAARDAPAPGLDRGAAAAAARRAQLALRLATERLNAICEAVLSTAQRCRSAMSIAEGELAVAMVGRAELDDAVVARSERVLDEAGRKLAADRELAKAAAKASTLSLRHAATELRTDRAFALGPAAALARR